MKDQAWVLCYFRSDGDDSPEALFAPKIDRRVFIRRQRKTVTRTEFLFPGYAFLRVDAIPYRRSFLGVVGLARLQSGALLVLADKAKAELQEVVEGHQAEAEKNPVRNPFQAGDCVTIKNGPLSGLVGQVHDLRGANGVTLELLATTASGRRVAVPVGNLEKETALVA